MSTLYPNSGALFPNDRKVHEKSPDFNGDIQVDVELLKELISQANEGLVKIRLGGWRKQTSRGWMLSLKVSSPAQRQKAPAVSNNDLDDCPF
jgi:hypothetical protein